MKRRSGISDTVTRVTMMLNRYALMLMIFTSVKSNGVSNAHSVFDTLFANYSRTVRPVIHDNTTITNERNEQLSVNYWLIRWWTDEYLKWDPVDYDGLEEAQFPATKIWLPDLFVYGMLTMEDKPALDDVLVRVYHNGLVRFSSNQFLTYKCAYDMKAFPFDKHNCTIKIGSWSYHGGMVDLQPLEPTLNWDEFKKNTEWELDGVTWERFSYVFDGWPWPGMNYNISIRRKPGYYLNSQVLPAYIISTLAICGLFSPFDAHGTRQEKVSMGLTTLLTMAVVLTVVSDEMPKSDTALPLVGEYILYLIIQAAVASLCTIFMMYLNKNALIYKWDLPEIVKALTLMRNGLEVNPSKPVPGGDAAGADSNVIIKVLNKVIKKKMIDPLLIDKLHLVARHVERIRLAVDGRLAEDRLAIEWTVACQRIDLYLMAIFQISNLVLFLIIYHYDAFHPEYARK